MISRTGLLPPSYAVHQGEQCRPLRHLWRRVHKTRYHPPENLLVTEVSSLEMNATENHSIRLPLAAVLIYLGILSLILILDPFGSPRHVPESEVVHPRKVVKGPCSGFGHRLIRGADWTGDGVEEIVVAVSRPRPTDEGPSASCVMILDGRSHQALAPRLDSPFTERDQRISLKLLPDVTGDGMADLAVGFTGSEGGASAGAVVVYSGGIWDTVWIRKGTGIGTRYGWALARVEDLDGDRIPDLAIGAPGSRECNTAGRVHIVSSTRALTIQTLAMSHRSGDCFGFSISTPSTDSGELMVGVPHHAARGFASGAILVYSLHEAGVVRKHLGSQALARLGRSIFNLRDLNGDRVSDFALVVQGGQQPDHIEIRSGDRGRLLYRIQGEHPGDAFGHSIAAVGDIDGDGVSDFAAGAPLATQAEIPEVGCVRIFSGRDGALLRHLPGSEEGSHFGQALTVIHDENNQAILLIASPMTDERRGHLSLFPVSSLQ